ncbi:hypothetical protein MHIB_10520 [Mycolicibacter hiberniae]|uniref:Uncharacterized protein n=1 Tax=Mycolicibacter hiberniae TaxID=29314 RepID=A0A7I7WYS6_9MYCO|nr:hypothetical protein MHIB_10520 [Mycolicibacter hiberniae]
MDLASREGQIDSQRRQEICGRPPGIGEDGEIGCAGGQLDHGLAHLRGWGAGGEKAGAGHDSGYCGMCARGVFHAVASWRS